jgi:hypothetical protein
MSYTIDGTVHGTRRVFEERKNPRRFMLSRVSVLRRNLPEYSLVPRAGIEPARLAAGDFESPASTNFTTWACLATRAQAMRAAKNADYV